MWENHGHLTTRTETKVGFSIFFLSFPWKKQSKEDQQKTSIKLWWGRGTFQWCTVLPEESFPCCHVWYHKVYFSIMRNTEAPTGPHFPAFSLQKCFPVNFIGNFHLSQESRDFSLIIPPSTLGLLAFSLTRKKR